MTSNMSRFVLFREQTVNFAAIVLFVVVQKHKHSQTDYTKDLINQKRSQISNLYW